MKGVNMSIKLVQQNRVAEYGIALGAVLYAVWRGLARIVPSGVSSREYPTPSRCKAQQRSALPET
jgi:hypothetical protein